MNIKEYVKEQAKICKNRIMRNIFVDLDEAFTRSIKSTHISYNVPNKSASTKIIDDSSMKNKKIYILPDYNNDKSVSTRFMKTGYISTISEDIVADNGDIYELKGIYQTYKFYKFNGDYYVRSEGSNVVTKINELNLNRFKNMIEYIELNAEK